jgi:hypothetical protein
MKMAERFSQHSTISEFLGLRYLDKKTNREKVKNHRYLFCLPSFLGKGIGTQKGNPKSK